jgi:hypothetical protein
MHFASPLYVPHDLPPHAPSNNPIIIFGGKKGICSSILYNIHFVITVGFPRENFAFYLFFTLGVDCFCVTRYTVERRLSELTGTDEFWLIKLLVIITHA